MGDCTEDGVKRNLSQEKAHASEGTKLQTPIAIIGMACRLPGEVSSLESFWDFCLNARNSWSEFPKERCDPSAFHHPNPEKIGCFQLSGAHFLKESVSTFDTSFFNITEEEAKAIDPRHRMLLECTYEALENGGVTMSSIAGQDVGVYVGATLSHYEVHCLRDFETAPRLQHMGCADSFLANRISYFYDLKGPSVSLDTACSSGLAALHLACQSIRIGDIKQAIVGGCQLNLMPEVMASVSSSMLYSASGKCFPFDERVSGGFGPGEGASCVILKPLRDAIDAGDNIRAVIRNTGMNQNGRTSGISMPSADSQASLMRSVYESAGLDPSDTKYVEAHGTGTTVGDPLEATALVNTFAERATPENPVYIGSAKSNFGHLEGVSGIVSIIKAAMMLQKRTILPNANFETANPKILSLGKILKIATSPLEWTSSGTRRASVNNLGSGGSNVHAILEEDSWSIRQSESVTLHNGLYAQDESWKSLPADASGTKNHYLYVLTANDVSSAKLQTQSLKEYLEKRSGRLSTKEHMLDLAYTLGQRRSFLPCRVAIVASDIDSLIAKLGTFGAPPPRATKPPKLGFVFTGQGANWHAMGRELLHSFPLFFSTITLADRHLTRLGAPWSLVEELSKGTATSLLQKAHISQPACTAIQLALVKLLDSWGVRPHAVTGHSSGEIAAAFATGALTLESCMSLAYYRGIVSLKLSENFPEKKGAMLAIGTSYEDANSMISELEESQVVVACINSPSSVTASGDARAINELQKVVENKKLFCRKLNVDVAYHSHHMDLIAEEYRTEIGNIRPTASKNVQFFSSLLGRKISTLALGSSYWVSNLKSPVQFSRSLLSCCSLDQDGPISEDSVTHLVEIGPHAALRGPIRDILTAGPKTKHRIGYSTTLVRDENAVASTLNMASELFMKGCDLSMSTINFPKEGYKPRVLPDLSPYPWNHEKSFWHESRITQFHRLKTRPRNDILGTMMADSCDLETKWRNIIRLDDIPWLRHYKIQSNYVFPFAGYIAMAIEAVTQQINVRKASWSKIDIRELSFNQPLVMLEGVDIEITLCLKPVGESSLRSQNNWSEFSIFTWTTSGCIQHCRGRICAFVGDKYNEVEGARPSDLTWSAFQDQIETIKRACVSSLATKRIYDALNSIGLEYGPCMAMLSDCYVGDNNAMGCVQLSDTASLMPYQFETDFVIHPAFLESCFQIVWPLLGVGKTDINAIYCPSSVEHLVIRPFNKSYTENQIRVLGTVASTSLPTEHTIKSLLVLADDAHQPPAITVDGLILTEYVDQPSIIPNEGMDIPSPSNALSARGTSVISTYSKIIWEPCLDLLGQQEFQDYFRLEAAPDDEIQGIRLLELASLLYFKDALKEVTDVHYNSLQERHQKFYRSMQNQLQSAKAGKNALLENQWDTLSDSECKNVQEAVHSQGSTGSLLSRIGGNISRIMLEGVDISSLMLEDDLLEEYYRCSPPFVRSNKQAATLVSKLAHENPKLRILEIGAGTGGVTLPVLEALGKVSSELPRFENYIFTDVSSAIVGKAQNKLNSWESFMTFRKLNIEDDPVSQGYGEGTFDLIIAAKVLHATPRMSQTLQNVRKLLKPGGKLLLVEITAPKAQLFPFDLMSEWWLCQENCRNDGPLLTEQQWDEILKQTGFSGIDHSLHDYPAEAVHSQSVMLSTANDTIQVPGASKDLVIIHSHPSTRLSLDLLKESLRDITGQIPKIVTLDEILHFELTNSHCIFLDELVRPMLVDISTTDFRAIQKLCSAQAILWVVQGGQTNSSTPEASMAIGLARCIRSENPNVKLITVDLDERQKLSPPRTSELIADIYRATATTEHSTGTKPLEMEYLERNGRLCIPRVVQDSFMEQYIQKALQKLVPEYQTYHEDSRAMTLRTQNPGSLDSFYFADANEDGASGSLKPHEIEIQVKASALNFRDLMAGLGKLPFNSVGSDCAGIVTAVGSSVLDHSIGDRVCGLVPGGAFSTRLRNAASSFVSMPENLGFDESASLPFVFTMAYHSIVNLARLCRGESILIHAAAGGVGQAAIMLAQLMGAEIYATVGNARKKDLIVSRYGIREDHIFYSRDVSFEDGIMHITNQKGVDIVLNSLTGDSLQATWRCLTPFGRFVELGRAGILANSRFEMEPFIQNRTYAGVDLQVMMKDRPSVVMDILHKVFDLHSKGIVKPVYPLTIYPFSKIEDAFRSMQSGESAGKIVFVPESEDRVKMIPRAPKLSSFYPDASYLITGGSGGLAVVFTRWLASQGARHIILASRSGKSDQKTSKMVDELRLQGSNVMIRKCDVTAKHQVKELVEETSKSAFPIRGVIHGALDYRISLFELCTIESYMAVIRPKVVGAWNLHNALIDHNLDFFVCLASVTGHIGTPGASAYCATTTFLDAFSSYRASLGLAASTIDLGPVAGVGVIMRQSSELQDQVEIESGTAIKEKELHAILDAAISGHIGKDSNYHSIAGLELTGNDAQAYWSSDPKFSHMRVKKGAPSKDTGPGKAALSARQGLNNAQTLVDARKLVYECLAAKLSTTLMIDEDDLSPDKPLGVYGTYSLVAVELRNWIIREMDATVILMDLLADNTLATLTEKVLQKSKLCERFRL